jgi:hypothetical protein
MWSAGVMAAETQDEPWNKRRKVEGRCAGKWNKRGKKTKGDKNWRKPCLEVHLWMRLAAATVAEGA